MAAAENQPSVLLHDWEHELDIDPPFIGRKYDLKLIDEALGKRCRLFGVFGIRSVGKSRLVKQFLKSYIEKCVNANSTGTKTDENNTCQKKAPVVIRLDLEVQTDTSAVYANLCASIGEDREENNTDDELWINQLVKHVKSRRDSQYVFFFDNVELAGEGSKLAEDLKTLFWQLTSQCVNVLVFITSTTKFMSARLYRVYFCHELKPLFPTESVELLRVIAPDVDLGEYRDVIVKLSEGLPLLLSMIANELADDQGLITPKDMADMLATSRLACLSRQDFYAEKERIADIYKKFIERLHDVYRRRLAILGYIPGSFDVREAKEILGFESNAQAVDQALVPNRRRYMLNYDPETRRFNIQGILRECLEVFFAIKNVADVRKRYCSVFSAVMEEITAKLGMAECAYALSQFSHEQPNFQKLMKEVFFTTEDTYPFFITMATNCTDLIERFLLKESEGFYTGCLVMAGQYGNDIDIAMVNIAVGSMLTNAKGQLKKGAEYYRGALKALVPRGNRLQLATIYQRMGWNLHVQEQNVEAVKFFQKSLNISQCGGPEFHRLCTQSMNSLGITNTCLGRYEEAQKYHFMSLKRAKKLHPDDHPAFGFIYNNIGVLYGNQGDSTNALTYYLLGLENKKKNKASEASLLLSYNNVACEYSALKQYDQANELLEESLQKALEIGMSPSMLAILYDSKGKVLMAQKRYQEALGVFEKAVDLRKTVAPGGINHVESLLHAAVAKQRLEQYTSCVRTAKKVIAMKQKTTEKNPHNTFIAECYECLAEAYRKTGKEGKYFETLNSLESELCRLESYHMRLCHERSLEWVRKQLHATRDKIENSNLVYVRPILVAQYDTHADTTTHPTNDGVQTL